MANQLTLKVMETIVKRCKGYEPLPETQHSGKYGSGNTLSSYEQSYNTSKDVGINQREEALLSSVIHRQVETTDRSRVEGQKTPSFSKNGVVNLDALLRELKK